MGDKRVWGKGWGEEEGLEGVLGYFEEGGEVVGVEGDVLVGLGWGLDVVEDVVGNGGNVVVELVVGFGVECYYLDKGK